MKPKLLIILSMLLLTTTFSPITVSANSDVTPTQNVTGYSEIEPYGNITGYIYKIYNGKQWKRLWSYTYNRWEDPEWTLA